MSLGFGHQKTLDKNPSLRVGLGSMRIGPQEEIMNFGAARLKEKKATVINEAVQKRVAEAKVTPKDTEAIKANPFFKINFDPSVTPEEAKKLAEDMLVGKSEAEATATRRALQEFMAYLSDVRTKLADEHMALTNTETLAAVQSVYRDLDRENNEFNEMMKPIVEIIEAIYDLRTNGQTFTALDAIRQAKQTESENATKRDSLQRELAAIERELPALDTQIVEHSNDKTLFGFGKIKPAAQLRIDDLTARKDQRRQRLAEIRRELEAMPSGSPFTGEFAAQTEKLRELLDLSSDTHRDRQKALVERARSFVRTASERTNEVRGLLGNAIEHGNRLRNSNYRLSSIHAVIGEALTGATQRNEEIRRTLDTSPEGEGMLAKVKRDTDKRAVESHIAGLTTINQEAVAGFADLSRQAMKLKTMQDANEMQATGVNTVATRGIASTADQLVTVLQSIGAAAINESAAMARNTLQRMQETTDRVAQSEVIRVATGYEEVNQDLMNLLENLGNFQEVYQTGMDLQRKEMEAIRHTVESLREAGVAAGDLVSKSEGIQADVASGGDSSAKKSDKPKADSVFGV